MLDLIVVLEHIKQQLNKYVPANKRLGVFLPLLCLFVIVVLGIYVSSLSQSSSPSETSTAAKSSVGTYADSTVTSQKVVSSSKPSTPKAKAVTPSTSSPKTTTVPTKKSTSVTSVTAPSSAAAFSTSGNEILNAAKQVVTIHGVDRPSLEWSCSGYTVDGKATGIPASDFATMHSDWNANAVRIALDQDFWLSNANRYCSGYAATVDAAVKSAEANHLIVILDLHWSDAGNLGNTSPAQQCMADQNSIAFWQQVATKYKNDPNVWFELYNEPHDISWDVWLNGGTACGFQAAGMQQLYNTVRGTGANNIVLAGGLVYSSNLSGLTPIAGSNIAYAVHPYADMNTPDNWSTSDWDNRFGNLSATKPVIATEFGDYKCGATTYDAAILSYFKSHHIGYTAWAWYAGGCGFPSLVSDPAGDCASTMGCTIQQDLKSYPTTSYD